ncbi:MAG: hypothetical protein BroJett021_39870 [Chloroflexota bacterium]|nr:MAG: hypothetical protein BroJett021_39870 [Chloroflexota bacterium]
MPVIAFATFVVVAQHTPAVYYIRKSILEGMMRWRHRFGNLPDHDLHKGIQGKDNAPANQ